MRIRGTLLTVGLIVAFLAALPFTGTGKTARFRDGAPSVEDLVGALMTALHKGDRAALHALRVNEDEYVKIILPGSVKPGESLRQWPDDVMRYFWSDLDTKSLYSEDALLQLFGGHAYRVKAVAFDKGTQEYAAYTAHKQLRLDLETDDGQAAHLETGSIAELGGRFKFVSFKRD